MTVVRAVRVIGGAALIAIATACTSSDAPAPTTVEGEVSEHPKEDAAAPTPDAAEAPVPGPAVECAIGGAVEVESNDTAQTANAFTELTFCGALGTPADVDYATFDTPPHTKLGLFQAVIDGKVDFELTLNGGAAFGPSDTAKFGAGTYVVKAFTKAGKTASYSYRVQFDPQ